MDHATRVEPAVMPAPALRPAVLALADLTGCRSLADVSTEAAIDTFVRALTDADASIVEVISHAYPGQGLTCVAILKESHAVLHTWPELGVVHVDIFSCTGSLDAELAIASLARAFGAGAVARQSVRRASEAPSAAESA